MSRRRRRAMERKQQEQTAKDHIVTLMRSTVVATTLMISVMTTPVWAMPQGGQVTTGAGVITQQGAMMTVNQSTDKLAVHWQSFSIAGNEKVNFVQPSAQSIALNQILGNDATAIYGQLTANGKVFLTNPNGILFASGAQVNVGGIVASTMGITDKNFMAGRYVFTERGGKGFVINQGMISAANGGYVILAGREVANAGMITAHQGMAALVAGGSLVLDLPGDGKVNLFVDQGVMDAAVTNSGVIKTAGGQSILLGKAGNAVRAAVVNNTGIIEAKTISRQNGMIILDGSSMSVVQNSGTLDVSGKEAGQTGGTVKVLGEKVALVDHAQIDVSGNQGGGTALVGGNYQGTGPQVNATEAYISKDTKISAEAIDNGNGGKVIIWSNEATRFYGAISAQGGVNGGDGGFIETSGKNYLEAQGTVNASAVKGQAGTWLLDPHNVTITSLATATGNHQLASSLSSNAFAANLDSGIVTTDSINMALSSGSHVVVSTSTDNSQSQPGIITVAENITKDGANSATLTLHAAGGIVIKNGVSITSNAGKLNIDFNADIDGVNGGTIQMQPNSQIITKGGTIDFYGGTGGLGTGYAGSSNVTMPGIALQGGVLLDTTIASGIGGYINLRGSNSMNVDSNNHVPGNFVGILLSNNGNIITSGGGAINLLAYGNGCYAQQEALSIAGSNTLISAGTGAITLTADRMSFSSSTAVQGSGNLYVQPLSISQGIDIGTTTLANNLQLESRLFNGVVFKHGFAGATLGRGNGDGMVTISGVTNFVDNTTVQSPKASSVGTINIAATANLTSSNGKSIDLIASTIAGAASGTINSSGDVHLTADVMHLGDGSSVGSHIQGTGMLYLRPFNNSTTIDLGTGFISGIPNHLQLNNNMFNVGTTANKVFSGFSGYTIGGSGYINGSAGTADINVTNIATFAGALALESNILTVTAAGKIDPTGCVRLQADEMNFDSGATVTGNGGTLKLHSYTSSRGMVVGETTPYESNSYLLIPNSYFAGPNQIFTGHYNSSITFGDLNSMQSVLMNSAVFPVTNNINILALGSGTAAIKGAVAVAQNINVSAGTITTYSGSSLTSTSGDITLVADVLNLAADKGKIHGIATLNLQSYKGNIGLVDVAGSNAVGGLTLTQKMFNVAVTGHTSAGPLDNTFKKIAVSTANGTGTVYVKNIYLMNDLDLNSYHSGSTSGNIQIAGFLNNATKTVTMKASGGATQSAGVITAQNLALLGGSSADTQANYLLTGNNAVNRLGSDAGSVKFHNAQELALGAVNYTYTGTPSIVTGLTATYANNAFNAVMSTGDITISSDASLTVTQAVTSNGGSIDLTAKGNFNRLDLQSGARIKTTTSSGDITLTANGMTFDSAARVTGTGNLKIQTYNTTKNVGIGGTGGYPLELAGSLFSGGTSVIQDGFSMINIGAATGTGTVTVDNMVTFNDPVTIQSGISGKVVIGTGGFINNFSTNNPVILQAGTIQTQSGSLLNDGSGRVTLNGNIMDFSGGGSIVGTGMLAIQSLDSAATITLGGTSLRGLLIDSIHFNNVVSNTFNHIIVGSSRSANPIVVHDFTSPDSLILNSTGSGGSVTVKGTLTMSGGSGETGGKELTIGSYGDITDDIAHTGKLTNVATLQATSTHGGIHFTNQTSGFAINPYTGLSVSVAKFGNTITKLGTLSAKNGISISNFDGATYNISSTKLGLSIAGTVNSTTGDVLIRNNGNLTIANGGKVTTTTGSGGNVYLSAEGTFAHFFNNGGTSALSANNGTKNWLIYSYSPLVDSSIASNDYVTMRGGTAAQDSVGLTSDFKKYGKMYDVNAPDSITFPANNKKGLLYAYAPFLTPILAEKTYGNNNSSIVYQFETAGFINGDTATSTGLSSMTLTGNFSTQADNNTAANTYLTSDPRCVIITNNVPIDSLGYIIKNSVIPLQVDPRNITVTADTISKTYDGTNVLPSPFSTASYTISASGWYDDGSNTDYNNRSTIIRGAPTLTNILMNGSYINAGNYTNEIVQGGVTSTSGNYTITFVPGSYIIHKAHLTVTADPQTKIYGDANPILTATITGFKNSQTMGTSGVTGVVALVTGDEKTNVGTVAITSRQGTLRATNYDFTTYNPGIMTIKPATLTYIADAVKRNTGVPNPIFSGVVTGFKNNETLSSVTTGMLKFDSLATINSPIGKYAIDGSGVTANHGNYSFVQATSNAEALHVKGLPPSAQQSVDNAKQITRREGHQLPTGRNLTNPGGGAGPLITIHSPHSGDSMIAVRQSNGRVSQYMVITGTHGALTISLSVQETNKSSQDGVGDMGTRHEGLSVSVFYNMSGNVTSDGLYNVSYEQNSLTLIPTPQSVTMPPAGDPIGGPSTIVSMTMSNDETATYRISVTNDILVIQPLNDVAKANVNRGSKTVSKMLIATAILTAIQDLGVRPDQIQAVFINK